MISLILASYLAAQEWSWLRSPEADVVAYRICVSPIATEWCESNCVTIPATSCDATRCWGDVPEPSWSPTFFIVTALDNEGNESDTNHGEIVLCP
jgi:hypothetical protein